MACFRTKSLEGQRIAQMTFAMLGLGNGGMILGWWVDAGFAPVSLACPHCQVTAAFNLTVPLSMPWMYMGMLALGIPPMVLSRDILKAGLGRVSLGALSAIGMVIGMSYGSYLFLKFLGTGSSQRFMISLTGMTLGMLLGMFFCCELGRAIILWLRLNRTKNGMHYR
jgi:hypothetical protein